MRKALLLFLLTIITLINANAGTVSGIIKDKNGKALAFSSILVKGTTQGVSANGKGLYSIQLPAGDHVLVAQFIGHQSVEKKIKVGKEDLTLDFLLEEQQYQLNEVTVKAGGEDPAYAIIRKTIAKRDEHLNEIKKFQCQVYLKGQMQLRDYPKKFFGKTIDFEDGDTSKRKMLFLSESVAKYSVEEPRNEKVEIISTKVSGQSNSFGLGSPQIISFYENTIKVGDQLNPRGFISPISDNALAYYRYKFMGTFYENGVEVSRIRVTPKRKYEPLFTGYIHIVENEWRLQSVQLYMLKDQQMQYLDTLKIDQLYVPAGNGNVWVIKNQVIYPSGKLFGFDFFGNFVQVYDQFDLNPSFQKKFFDNTVLKYYDSSNKKTMAYWDSVRPVPLLPEEVRDYVKKDSLEQVRKDPHYLDSLDKKRNKVTILGVLFSGQSFYKTKKKENISFESIISTLNYNTVEGGAIRFTPRYARSFKKDGETSGRKFLSIDPEFRYGFANTHFNASVAATYTFGDKYIHSFSISGGRKVLQYNNGNPIGERNNTIATLLYEANHMKIYEAEFIRMEYSTGIGNGIDLRASFQFQNRYGLDNLADMVYWKDKENREFTPNYPTNLSATNMPGNQASTISLSMTWRPGGKYMELPGRKISLGSKYPTINASITKGINGLFGSDVDYTKWQVTVNDNLDLKLAGKFNYRLSAGGFIDAAKTFIPDYQHIMGNQTVIASGYLYSFQLAPYYKYSNTSNFFSTAQVEYHLNGLISNKIPGYRKLNWFFVLGANALHINGQDNYYETLFGIENIFKVIRVDYVLGFGKNIGNPSGFRFSVPL